MAGMETASRSQWYIGAPNGIVLCIDSLRSGRLTGRLYHSYREDAQHFVDLEQMILQMEALYDMLNFPYRGTDKRQFLSQEKEKTPYQPKQERIKIMSDEKLLSKHGDIGSFIVRVQHRQNSSWQGRITWMEQNKTVNFRSVWEMVKLIEDAVDTVSVPEDEATQGWFEDR